MPAQITNYQCPACTGPMQFDSQTGKLKCEYCESIYEVAEVEALYAEKEAAAVKAHEEAQQKAAKEAAETAADAAAAGGVAAAAGGAAAEAAAPAEDNITTADGAWGTSKLSSDWGAEAEQMRSYSCPSCGAELICDATTAATSCLYCGNPTVIPSQFSGVLKPDYVIPFKLDKEAAKEALKAHYKGKLLLPPAFKKENHVEEITGVYVPFWLFDGTANADVHYKAKNSTTVRSGNYNVTTTHHYNVRRAGLVSFEKIPVDASSKMPDLHMESIEPYDYSELKPFSTAYMPGYLADKYDVSVEDCSSRADTRSINSALEVMRNSVSGYSSCTEHSRNVQLQRGEVEYAMAPVWMLNTRWKDQNFLFAMNGQTGKLVGDLPVSESRFWALVSAVTVGLTIIGSIVWFLFL